MKRLALFCLTLALLLLGISVIAAQDETETLPNDPRVNPDANACSEGGSMEGKCGDSEYLWAGGWYKIRFDYGLIGRDIFPDQYKWELPKLEAETAAPATCKIDVGSANAGALGLSSSIVNIPLAVINGTSDPNAAPGATPYGFDWSVSPVESILYMYVSNPGVGFTVWDETAAGASWNPGIVSNTCPTPTSP
jgi:hypothetical protein